MYFVNIESSQKDVSYYAKSQPPKPEIRQRVRSKWSSFPPGPGVKELTSETNLLIKAELGSARGKTRGNKVFQSIL